MIDDLISRKAAIEAMEKWATRPVIMKSRYFESKEKAIVLDMMGIVKEQPAIPAVPLDELCEWLERYATMDCEGCREAFGSCEDEENQEVSVCNSRERWKAMLKKWMEEQDAAD